MNQSYGDVTGEVRGGEGRVAVTNGMLAPDTELPPVTGLRATAR